MNFSIDEKLINDIAQYLSEKPYREVFTFIEGIRNLKAVEIIEEPKEEKTETE